MKYLLLALIIASVSASSFLPELEIGQSCTSSGGFTVSGFSISPFPPIACNPQAIVMNGTFTGSYCPNQVHMRESFGGQTYDQYISLPGTCFVKGNVNSFTFIFNTVECNKGPYTIQALLEQQSPNLALSCWQYTYTLS